MAKQYYYFEDELFAEFRKRYPDLWEYGTTYYGCGFQTIRVRIPNKGCVEYNRFANSLRWIDRHGDKEYEKALRVEKRNDMYAYFLKNISEYQTNTGATQGEIAKLSGISRQKINEYINGKRIPKIDTMNKILKSLERKVRCEN